MIKLEDLFVVFDKGEPLERTAIRCINLSINAGEKVSVLGNNGSGKSSLVRVLAGHIEPSFGKIFLDDKDITLYSTNEKASIFSTVFSNNNTTCHNNLTVIENLALSMLTGKKMSAWSNAINNKTVSIINEYIEKYDFLDLKNFLFCPVSSISHENKQALCLMMAIMKPMKFLLVDEFTYGLKKDLSERLWTTLKNIADDFSVSVIAVIENKNVEFDFFTRTLLMSGGRILVDVSGEERKNFDFSTYLN